MRQIRQSGPGWRSFVADRISVMGFDDRADGFFRLAGSGEAPSDFWSENAGHATVCEFMEEILHHAWLPKP